MGLQILNKLKDIFVRKCNAESFKESARTSQTAFTRNRILTLPLLCFMILQNCKGGIRAAIRTFFEEKEGNMHKCSESAFCQARKKIRPEAFRELIRTTAEGFYACARWKKYHGYRVLAIDGSDLNLPNSPEALLYFGSEKFANGAIQAQALSSGLYDVLNHTFLDAVIQPFHANERKLALEQLDYLASVHSDKDLVLMDRGYPSAQLLSRLEELGLFYLIRCPKNGSFREIRTVSSPDEIVVRGGRKNRGSGLKFRVLTVTLENGIQETLITNILHEFSLENFKELYHLRWGIEEKYNDLKNKLHLECFTGTSRIVIEQDYYASVCLLNFVAGLEFDMADEIKEKYAGRKRQYQLNVAQTIGLLKEKLVRILLEDDPVKQDELSTQVEQALVHYIVSSPPGRSFPRKFTASASRYSANSKLWGA